MDTILALIFHAQVMISVCLYIFKEVQKSDKRAIAILSLLYTTTLCCCYSKYTILCLHEKMHLTYSSRWECFSEICWQPGEENEKHPTATELANNYCPTTDLYIPVSSQNWPIITALQQICTFQSAVRTGQ